ncbi:hypothetical protein MMPV_002746 [Pyropia vietnamensis]
MTNAIKPALAVGSGGVAAPFDAPPAAAAAAAVPSLPSHPPPPPPDGVAPTHAAVGTGAAAVGPATVTTAAAAVIDAAASPPVNRVAAPAAALQTAAAAPAGAYVGAAAAGRGNPPPTLPLSNPLPPVGTLSKRRPASNYAAEYITHYITRQDGTRSRRGTCRHCRGDWAWNETRLRAHILRPGVCVKAAPAYGRRLTRRRPAEANASAAAADGGREMQPRVNGGGCDSTTATAAAAASAARPAAVADATMQPAVAAAAVTAAPAPSPEGEARAATVAGAAATNARASATTCLATHTAAAAATAAHRRGALQQHADDPRFHGDAGAAPMPRPPPTPSAGAWVRLEFNPAGRHGRRGLWLASELLSTFAGLASEVRLAPTPASLHPSSSVGTAIHAGGGEGGALGEEPFCVSVGGYVVYQLVPGAALPDMELLAPVVGSVLRRLGTKQ